ARRSRAAFLAGAGLGLLLGLGACRSEDASQQPASDAPRTAAVENAQPAPAAGSAEVTEASDMTDQNSSEITFGAGCFWCVEAVLEQVDGVLDVESGYMGGAIENPTYKQICTGTTGHAEVVRVRFDPEVLPLDDLLAWFWQLHDPTTLNRQGNDVGTQYRSAIYYTSEEQRVAAEASKAAAQVNFKDPIVTEVTEASTFWPAEEYHQEYYRNNANQGYCRFVIAPKLKKLDLEY
ncbi:MAG: peptide-methionine (S)-S-oxide reductase MsrA, partial [Planctomycetota bacterium]